MEVDIKIDYSETTPFRIRETNNKKEVYYREIDFRDQIFFEGLSESQKYTQIKRIDDQSKLLNGSSLFDNNTVIIQENQQLNLLSNLFLVILLYDNQSQEEMVSYVNELSNQLKNQLQIKKYLIIILINNKDKNKLKINERKEYYEDCSAKLFINYQLGENQASLFIMNKKQDKISLLNLIYLGLAIHFNPKYLLVQEVCYNISNLDDYFPDDVENVAAIVPIKIYKKDKIQNYSKFHQYLLQYKQFLNIQNPLNAFYYDSFNCFYNYDIAKQYLQKYVFYLQNAQSNQDICNLNLKFCQYIYNNNLKILMKSQIEFQQKQKSQYDRQNDRMRDIFQYYKQQQLSKMPDTKKGFKLRIQTLRLNKQINYLFQQYYKVNKYQYIIIADYYHLSQCLFPIIILPYYLIYQQTDSQALHVFVSIIPGFIIVALTFMLILINLVFNLYDPISIGSYGQKINIVIQKYNKKYYYHDYFGQNNRIQQVNSQFQIIKGDLLITLNFDNCQQLYENEPVIFQEIPKIITYPILWIYNKYSTLVITVFNLFYFILIIYMIAFQIQNQIKIRYEMTIIIIVLICLILILKTIQYLQEIFKYLINNTFQFIQTNIFNVLIEEYTRSNEVEQNLASSQNYIMKILHNAIMTFLFIIIDYCSNFRGGVFVGILTCQVLKQFYQQYIYFYKQQYQKSNKSKAASPTNHRQFDDSQSINMKDLSPGDELGNELNKKCQEVTMNYSIIAEQHIQLQQITAQNQQIRQQHKSGSLYSSFQQDKLSLSIVEEQPQSESDQYPDQNQFNQIQHHLIDESPIKGNQRQEKQQLNQLQNDKLFKKQKVKKLNLDKKKKVPIDENRAQLFKIPIN